MSDYGYIGQESDRPTQAFKSNAGIFSPNDIINLDNENKWTKYGQLELIHTEDVTTAVANVDFQESAGTFDTSYNVHFFTYNNITPTSDNVSVDIQLYENGTLETGSVYHNAYQYGSPAGFDKNNSTTATTIRASWGIGTTAQETVSGYKYLYNLSDSTKFSFSNGHWTQLEQGASAYFFGYGGAAMRQSSFVDGFRFKVLSGNFTGTLSLYGIRSFD
jgi:hypothetical protein